MVGGAVIQYVDERRLNIALSYSTKHLAMVWAYFFKSLSAQPPITSTLTRPCCRLETIGSVWDGLIDYTVPERLLDLSFV